MTSSPEMPQPAQKFDECPNCNHHLKDGPFRREIGLRPSTNDGVLLWLCPKCSFAWPRFCHGDRGKMARRYCDAINESRGIRLRC